jgi:hypothetical protein
VAPVFQQGPWLTELMLSASVSHSPFYTLFLKQTLQLFVVNI